MGGGRKGGYGLLEVMGEAAGEVVGVVGDLTREVVGAGGGGGGRRDGREEVVGECGG